MAVWVAPMICPVCASVDWEPPIDVQGLTVCHNCGSSLVIATGERATQAEIRDLSEAEVSTLRKARNRPKRQRV